MVSVMVFNTTFNNFSCSSWLIFFFQSSMESLHQGIEGEPCGFVQRLFDDCDKPKLLANSRDKVRIMSAKL